jgi:two-component system LytT family response regulator
MKQPGRKPIAPQSDGIRVLVVDDELPARQRLTDLLRRDPSVRTLLEAPDGKAAVEIIRGEAPDIVFLDIQMPEMTGLEVVEQIGPQTMPLTIFVTAYDQHAIRAFDANALDYLLKPFSDERFEAAMTRARARLDDFQLRDFGNNVRNLIAAAHTGARHLDRLAIKAGGATQFIAVAGIDWIEAAGVYVHLHAGEKLILHRTALTELLGSLDPRKFVRVHRSAAVNIDSIVRLEPLSHGEFDIMLKNGGRVRVSRTYRANLEAALGQSL